MSLLKDNFVPTGIYNSLPLISQVAETPHEHAQDLVDLRDLLMKHKVPKGVSVRLIHKHFDTSEGEIMVFVDVPVPEYGFVKIMKPVHTKSPKAQGLRGIHYFVDEDGTLQAYEYGHYEAPDISGFQDFLEEFCTTVSSRDLQHKFGLKIQNEDDAEEVGWTEYELHAKRATIMFPDGMPMPDGESDFSVTTEWKPVLRELARNCKHNKTCKHGDTVCKHCTHCRNHANNAVGCYEDDGSLVIGGQKLMPGTAVHEVVGQIIAAF